jgi:serine phosphatase RsbU (regulator of sigma subunit)
MPQTLSSAEVKLPEKFTDILYISGKEIPPEVRKLFKSKKLSCHVLGPESFTDIRDRLDLIGTVIIDIDGMGIYEQQKLARIIQTLEMENIGVILLGGRVEVPIKSFSLAPVKKSFTIGATQQSISTDELWTRISVNLAYRKKSPTITVKPAVLPHHTHRIYNNKLAEQLSMTGAMVDNLAEQLRLAGLVQQDFLPTRPPNSKQFRWATTFLPAEWVSGDIYDIVEIDPEHIGFYVADVVGHGMPAALLTIFLKQAFIMRKTIDDNSLILPPGEVMKNLNRRMAGQKLSGYQFATCCYCLLNTKTLKLTFARAGHPHPILIKPHQEPQQLETKGSLLGIFGQAEYTEQTIQLEPGDKLIIYSDGAEHIIGNTETSNFEYSKDLLEIKDLPIIDMFDRFNMLAQSKQADDVEVDDITIIGLQVL